MRVRCDGTPQKTCNCNLFYAIRYDCHVEVLVDSFKHDSRMQCGSAFCRESTVAYVCECSISL